MYSKDDAKTALRKIDWKEGAIVPILEAPYRYRVVAHCSSRGRQIAEFSNGEHTYFCYIEVASGNGRWIERGANVVPVLPDGRLIMVVEQRPAQGRYPGRPMIAEIQGERVDLHTFGPCSSLEFPGGAVEPGEGLRVGILRELTEETGIQEQTVICYSQLHPLYAFGSDFALQNFVNVVFLSGSSYEKFVRTDGGLNVFALTPDEIQRNIWNGVIHSGQAGLLPWSFYKEIENLRHDSILMEKLIRSGYIRVENIKVGK